MTGANCICICIYICVCVCIYICVCVCICICICICIDLYLNLYFIWMYRGSCFLYCWVTLTLSKRGEDSQPGRRLASSPFFSLSSSSRFPTLFFFFFFFSAAAFEAPAVQVSKSALYIFYPSWSLSLFFFKSDLKIKSAAFLVKNLWLNMTTNLSHFASHPFRLPDTAFCLPDKILLKGSSPWNTHWFQGLTAHMHSVAM